MDMNEKEKLKQLQELVEEAKEIARKAGINGEFTCPSCKQTKPRVEALVDNNLTRLCSKCYVAWGEAKLKGKVKGFKDVVPKNDMGC